MRQQQVREAGRVLLEPLVSLLAAIGAGPSSVTLAGLAVTGGAAILVWRGSYVLAGAVLIVGSVLDALDGALARKKGLESRTGAVLDSVSDRLGEALVLTAIIAGEASVEHPILLVLTPLALTCSFLVSYVRARAEGVGIDCSVGHFTRTERLVIMIAGLVIGGLTTRVVLVAAVALIGVGSMLTAAHRMIHVRAAGPSGNRRPGPP